MRNASGRDEFHPNNPSLQEFIMTQGKRDFSELYGYRFEDLQPEMSASLSRTVGEADILMFAGVSGDTNPVHLDAEFAESTMFGGRIAHGMLSAAFVSAVFGTRLPGPGCIYLSQNLKFKAPVKIGDTVVARVTVKELKPEKRRAIFSTVCTVGGKVVLDGEAEIMIPARD
jgi:3-hydroxybutyryl-CoA dehydratase